VRLLQTHCLVMEHLTPHIIPRRGLIEGRRYPDLGCAPGEYVARASFFTSDLAQPFERKMDSMARFTRNTPLVRTTVDLVFTDPYCASAQPAHLASARCARRRPALRQRAQDRGGPLLAEAPLRAADVREPGGCGAPR